VFTGQPTAMVIHDESRSLATTLSVVLECLGEDPHRTHHVVCRGDGRRFVWFLSKQEKNPSAGLIWTVPQVRLQHLKLGAVEITVGKVFFFEEIAQYMPCRQLAPFSWTTDRTWRSTKRCFSPGKVERPCVRTLKDPSRTHTLQRALWSDGRASSEKN